VKILVLGSGGVNMPWLGGSAAAPPSGKSSSRPATRAARRSLPASVPFGQTGRPAGSRQSDPPDLTIVAPKRLSSMASSISSRPRPPHFRTRSGRRPARRQQNLPKDFMRRHAIPTARYAVATTEDEAQTALRSFSYPIVLKADGLAAGKGVVICPDRASAFLYFMIYFPAT